MRHATPLDAFNAAADLTRQTLQPLTRAKEYELDSEIYRRSIDLSALENRLILDYTRVDPGGENKWQQRPEEYQKYVERELAKWRGDADKAGNGSAYYKRRLDELEAQGRLAMGQRYNAAVVEVENQRVDVAHAKNQTAILNSGQEAPVILKQLLEEQENYDRNREDPAQAHQRTEAIVNTAFKKAIEISGEDIGDLDIAGVKAVRDRQIENLKKAAAERLPEGETIDRYVQNMTEQLKNSDAAITRAVWNRNRLSAETAHNAYKALAEDAAQSADPAVIQTVLDRQRAGREFVEQAGKSGEYDPEDLAKMLSWYALPEKLTKTGGGSKGDKPSDGDITNLMQILVDETAWGTYRDTAGNKKTFYDLDESKVAAVWSRLSDEQKAYFGNDMLEFEKEYAGNALKGIQEYINTHNKNIPGSVYIIDNMKKLITDVDESTQPLLLSAMNDLYYSVQHDTYTEKEFREKTATLKDLVKAGKFKEVGKARAGDENSMAAAAAELLEKQETIFTTGIGDKEKVMFLSDQFEQEITGYAEQERALLANVFGVDTSQLKHNWREEEGQRYDVMGLGEYTVSDEEGVETGIFVRMRPEAADRKAWEFWKPKYRPVYEYKEGPDGEWKPFTPEKPPSAFGQLKQQRLDDHEELLRITAHSTPRPVSIDEETWLTTPQDLKIGIIENILNTLENPNPEKIPPKQWEELTRDQQREKIFAYFRGEL